MSVDLVRELFGRFNSDDRTAVLELLTEDFVAEIPPSLSAEPDVYEGREGALRYLEAFDGLIDDVHFEPIEFYDERDAVIVELRLTGRGVSSGIEVAQTAAVVVWADGGRVRRMEPFPDLEAARERLERTR
jgi:ketosteroid isomerase-like protein